MGSAATEIPVLLDYLDQYPVETDVLTRCRERVASRGLPLKSEEALRLAVDLQLGQGNADVRWLSEIGVPQDILPTVASRMAMRGAVWLEFVELITGFEGDYSGLH
jgi:hypothetical protein